MAESHPSALESARRAIEAWTAVSGLAAEIERLRWSVDGAPVPAPGLAELLDDADILSQRAQDALEAEQRSDGPERATHHAEAARCAIALEEAARRVAQLCLGVSSCLPASDAVSRSEHACVLVLERYGLSRFSEDERSISAERWAEAEVLVCGLICRIILSPDVFVTIRGPEMAPGLSLRLGFGWGDALMAQVELAIPDNTSAGRLEGVGWTNEAGTFSARFEDPVTVREVSQLVVETCRDIAGIPSPDLIELRLFFDS